MPISTFKRGLRLNPRKHATEGTPVEQAPAPKTVVIPINQHFGAPNKSLVAVGDKVRRGQKIAEGLAPGPMTVPVHASISGTVKKIEPRTQSNNSEGMCIIIEADEPAEGLPAAPEGDDFMPPLDIETCTRDEALQRIRDAGLIGMGGAGFPTHVKINPPPTKTIDTIIADGAECEPYLTTDEACVRENPGLLVKGLSIIMKISGVKKAIIGMEDNKAELVPVIEAEVKKQNVPGEITVGLCKTLYPQGGEKMLIKALTGREVPSGGLPADVHCIVSNVGTLIATAEAFTLGKPLIERSLTVSGGACKTPKNIRAPIGAILTDMPASFIDIDFDKCEKILYGGPMMGNAVPNASIPIQKNTSGIIFLTKDEIVAEEEGDCIRCCRCINNCPMKLSPVVMNDELKSGDLDAAFKVGLLDCIECGSCSYMCPARIRLTQRFREGKAKLRNKQQLAKEAAAAAAARAAQLAEHFKTPDSKEQKNG